MLYCTQTLYFQSVLYFNVVLIDSIVLYNLYYIVVLQYNTMLQYKFDTIEIQYSRLMCNTIQILHARMHEGTFVEGPKRGRGTKEWNH